MNFTKILTLAFLIGVFNHCYAQDITIGDTELTETEVAVGLQVPWEIFWGPDDHLWVTERRGKVFRIEPESGNMTEILDYTDEVDYGGGEPGMLGLCLHPDFDTSPLVYIVFSDPQGFSYSNTLLSFEWNGTELVNPQTILDNLNAGGIHSGARIIISQDEKILMTVGDGGTASTAQNMNSTGGKLLRVNLDGTIPADNPDPSSYVYSLGHRNAQGLCQAPDGKIYSSEHGQSAMDEINLIEPMANYGWPDVEGFCDDFPSSEPDDCTASGFTEPLLEFRPCMAVNDIAYYNHPAIPELDNTILMSVMKGFSGQSLRGLFVLHLNDDGTEMTFDEDEDIYLANKGRVRDVCIDPNTGDLYIAVNGNSYPGSGPNKIFRYSNEAFDSVNESVASQTLSIYPNPSASDVKFEVSKHLLGGTYSVISYDGKEVLKGDITSNTFVIEDGELNTGSYYVVVTSNLGSISRTFIVQ